MAGFNKLEAKDYEAIWESDSAKATREYIKERQEYYDGDQAIVNSNEFSADGNLKSERVANFIDYGIDMYVGSIVGDPINVTAIETPDEPDAENESPAIYRKIGTANSFDTADVTNVRNAYIAGYGIETHEFDSGGAGYVITPQNPIQWHIVWDSDGTLLGTIHRSTIAPGMFYQGEFLESELEIMVIFDDKQIKTFHKTKDKDGEWFEPDTAKHVNHQFGVPPVVVWQVNEDFKSHISDALKGQQDEYNESDSASGDGLKFDSDGILAIKGYAIQQIQKVADLLRKWKIFAVPEDGDIKFVTKDTDFQRIESRLKRTRAHIFMELKVPDIEEIVGATGDTSGIALQLKFKPMADNAKTMIAFIRAGVRDRIDLINSVKGAIGNAIKDVQVNISFDIPVNVIEQWKSVGLLDGIVSHIKQLELLDDVQDPDQEIKRLKDEREATGFIDRNNLPPEELTALNDKEIADKAVALAPKVEDLLAIIGDAFRNALNTQLSKKPKADKGA